MDARGIQHRVRRLIDISFEEPALRDKLIRSVETLEKDILSGESNEQRKLYLKKSQLEILKKIVVALGKKPEEVDEFIRTKFDDGKINTNEKGEVTELFLYSNELSGSIPPEIGQLTALRRLNLSGNELSDSIPPQIGQLEELTELSLHTNNLSGSIPPEIGQLTNLTCLALSVNELSGSIPPEIGQMKALKRIYLFNNKLSGSIPSELGELSSLMFLRISDNKELGGELPVFSPECRVDVSNTCILSSYRLYNK